MSFASSLARLIELVLLSLGSGIFLSWALMAWSLIQGRGILPEVEPRPARWSLETVARIVGLYFVIRLLVEIGFHELVRPVGGAELAPTSLIGLVTAVNFACLGMIPLGLLRQDRQRLSGMILNGGSLRTRFFQGLLTTLLAAPVAYGCHFGASLIWKPTAHPLSEMLEESFGPVAAFLAFISAVLLAPALEELLFRGVLLHYLTPSGPIEASSVGEICKKLPTVDEIGSSYSVPATPTTARCFVPTRGSLAANISVSLAFAGMHASQWPAPVPLFVLSMAFGVLFQRTGSLAAVVVAHAVFNLISTLAMIYTMLRGLPMIPN